MNIAVIECVFFLGVEVSKEQIKAFIFEFAGELANLPHVDSNKPLDSFDGIHALILGLDKTKFNKCFSESIFDDLGYFRGDTLEQAMIAYINMEPCYSWEKGIPLNEISTTVERCSLLREKKYPKISLHLRAARECAKNAGTLYDYRTFVGLTRKTVLSLKEAVSLLTGCDDSSSLHWFYGDSSRSPHYYGLKIVYFATDKIMSMAKKNGFDDTVNLTAFLRWANDQQLLFDDYLLDRIKVTRGKDQGLFAETIIKGFFSMEEIKIEGVVKNSVLKNRVRGKELDGYGSVRFEDGKYKSDLTGDEVTTTTINRKIRTLRNDKEY